MWPTTDHGASLLRTLPEVPLEALILQGHCKLFGDFLLQHQLRKKKYTRTNVKPRVSLKAGLPARRLSCLGFALRHLFGHSRLSHDRQPKLEKGVETSCSTRHIFSKTSSKRKSGSEIGGATFGSRQPARRRTLTTYFLPQTVYQHQGDVWRTLFYPHGSQYETHQVPQCWPLLNSNMGKRISHQ